MSSFLKRHENQEQPSSGGDNEELYERLFVKIGRDFVYKEDFVEMMQRLWRALVLLQPALAFTPIDFGSDAKARLKAAEYKDVLHSGKDGSSIYKDLIKLEDDEPDQDSGDTDVS